VNLIAFAGDIHYYLTDTSRSPEFSGHACRVGEVQFQVPCAGALPKDLEDAADKIFQIEINGLEFDFPGLDLEISREYR